MDYSTYAQLSGFPYMPTPETYYPEMGMGGVQQQEQQKQFSDFQQRSNQDYQTPSVPYYNPYPSQGRGENNSDGFQVNPYSSGRQCTSSEYRVMAREQKRAKEMKSRNGLYTPIEAAARYSGGDASHYANYGDGGRRMELQTGNSYW